MLPIVVGTIALVCAVLRKWRIAAFVVFALAVESATYRATTLVVHSHRPRVVRLESLPVNASYPSGHTAASIAVYGGLALLLTSRFTNRVVPSVRLDVRRGDGGLRRACHGCIAACTTRSTSPAASSWESRAGRHRLRLPGCAAPRRPRRRSARRRDEGRGDRTLRQDARRRPAELRRVLAAEGVDEPFWCEVPKSRKAPAQVRRALDEGAELVFAWGGDGMVQRCVDVLAGSRREPRDHSGRHGESLRRQPGDPEGHRSRPSRSDCTASVARLDVGRFNGERFAVMAGAGFDAAMIRDAGTAAQGSVRPRRLRLDGLGEPPRRSRFAPRSRSTASAGTRARRAASCSATSASSSAGSRRSKTRAPTTGSSSSVS